MNQSLFFGFLLGLLSYEVVNGLSLKRQLTCERDGKTIQQGATYSPNQCQDVCLCEDDGQLKCQPCSPVKPTSGCKGWTHAFVKMPFAMTNGNEECHCYKFECRKKSFKSMLLQLWQNFKNKISSDGDDDGDENLY